MACGAVLLAAIGVAICVVSKFNLFGSHLRLTASFFQFLAWCRVPPGLAVVGTWVVLKLTGRWQPESSSIDRMGRVLGIGWIGLSVAGIWS